MEPERSGPATAVKRFFDRALMTMELHGLVRVYSMAKDKRRIELVRG